MDGDLSKKLDDLLNSPDSMAKITQAMAALGLPSLSVSPPATRPTSAPAESATCSPLPDLSALLGMAPLLSSLGKDDRDTILLKALRPYLHGEREKKLDDSVKLMQLLKLLPILREGGIFK